MIIVPGAEKEYLLTAKELSRMVGVSTNTLAVFRCKNRHYDDFPYCKIGGRVYYYGNKIFTKIKEDEMQNTPPREISGIEKIVIAPENGITQVVERTPTKEEESVWTDAITGEPYKIDRLQLPFDYIIVGSDPKTAEKFDLKKIFKGLEKLADNFTED